MKRLFIYFAGFVTLGCLAAITLPQTGRSIEGQLRDELDYAIAEKGLTGIEARMDGQSVRLAYGADAAKTVGVDTPDALGPRMAWAVDAASSLRGGLYAAPGHGGRIWGPVTRITVDQPSIDALAAQIGKPVVTREEAVIQAKACTDDVAKAVAERKLNFISGSFELTPDSEVILDDIFAVIANCPGDLVLHVEGHTDDVGTDADNITLSTSRAEAAAKGLIERGLNSSEVEAKGFGETQPIADNATPEGQAENRRVMFILRPQNNVSRIEGAP